MKKLIQILLLLLVSVTVYAQQLPISKGTTGASSLGVPSSGVQFEGGDLFVWDGVDQFVPQSLVGNGGLSISYTVNGIEFTPPLGQNVTTANTATVNLALDGSSQLTAIVNDGSITPTKLDRTYLESELDGSTTNEIVATNSFIVSGTNLQFTEAGTTHQVPILDVAPTQSVTGVAAEGTVATNSSGTVTVSFDGTNIPTYVASTSGAALNAATTAGLTSGKPYIWEDLGGGKHQEVMP